MKSLLLSTIVAVTACTTPRETELSRKVPEAVGTVKPGAPTQLESEVSETRAKLSVRFEGPGENVSVTVSGIDGLTLTSPPEGLSGLSVKANEVRTLEVTFTRGPGRGHLVISVQGNFSGSVRSRVHTVAIGEGPLKNDGKVQVTPDGDAVKLIP